LPNLRWQTATAQRCASSASWSTRCNGRGA
jgi:hypothetical protein